MDYCPKCGAKVTDEMKFCPKCGNTLIAETTPVSAAPAPAPQPMRYEKQEKHEKEARGEKQEKYERREMREYSFMGPLVGGVILIFIGLAFYLALTTATGLEIIGASLFVLIGLIVIIAAVYAATVAARRHPST